MIAAVLLAALAAATAAPQTIDVWPGTAPGSETWTQKEQIVRDTPLGTIAIDVVKPTLTVYLPDPSRATGAGAIVAPGGAFVALTLDLEGADVARALQSRGIAAFVLAYRTIEKRGPGIPADLNFDEAGKYGMADGVRALAVVRAHAAQWHLDPSRIGFVGFSAGGMVASAALLNADAAARPAFTGLIYGAPFGKLPDVPAHLPPVFMAWAQDDDQAAAFMARFYMALKNGSNEPEAHVYASGGHGFGMRKQQKTSDYWFDEFVHWLEGIGIVKPR